MSRDWKPVTKKWSNEKHQRNFNACSGAIGSSSRRKTGCFAASNVGASVESLKDEMNLHICSHTFNGNLCLLKPAGIVLWLRMYAHADHKKYVFIHRGMMPRVAGITDDEFEEALKTLTSYGYWKDSPKMISVADVGFYVEPFFHHCLRKRVPIPQYIRQDVLSAGICFHCGDTDNLAVDHITPLKLNGGNERENLQPLCRSCNSAKRDRFIG